MTKKIVFLNFIFLIMLFSYCNKDKNKKNINNKLNDKNKPIIKEKIINIVKKYDAIIDWESNFEKRSNLRTTFTVEVENILIENNKPILLIAYILDIKEKGNYYILHCSNVFDLKYPTIRFVLKINKKFFNNKIDIKNIDFLDFFAFIIKINKIFKIDYIVNPINYEEVKIELPNEDIFIADGYILDFIVIENYYSKKELFSNIKK